jgi:hypothetical protein
MITPGGRCQCRQEPHQEAADERCESTETRRITVPLGTFTVCRHCVVDHRMPGLRGVQSSPRFPEILALWEV